LIEGKGGADYIDGGRDGVNTASYSNSPAAVVVNLDIGTGTHGDAQGDILVNIQNLIGSSYNDILAGNYKNNFIYGGDGADIIEDIGGGTDIFEGGSGRDRFIISTSPGNITIKDFKSEEDKINLQAFKNIKSFADVVALSTSDGINTVIKLSDTKDLILNGITDLKYTTIPDDYILNGDAPPQKWSDTIVGQIVIGVSTTAVICVGIQFLCPYALDVPILSGNALVHKSCAGYLWWVHNYGSNEHRHNLLPVVEHNEEGKELNTPAPEHYSEDAFA